MPNDTISLDEFVDYVKANVNFDDETSIRSVEPYLRKLNNNKNLLPEAICKELTHSIINFQPENTYQASGYIFYKDENFIVRAVCWLPQGKRKFTDADIDRGLLVFDAPHDHDFSFLTIGHYGPGYYSDIYEYDYESVLGKPNEPVKLNKLDFEKLNPDSTFFFRAARDVHIQIPPQELSISLNFMVRKRGHEKFLDQYWFDIKNQRIYRPLENDTYRRSKSIGLIAALMGEGCYDELYTLKDSHACRRTRIEILKTLQKFRPEKRDEIWEQARHDKDPVVRDAADQACS